MTSITLVRTDKALPAKLDAARELLFGAFDGLNRDHKRAWRGFWRRLFRLEPGEIANIEAVLPRLGWYHRKHMALEQTVFDAQERFDNFDVFRDWLKVGAGWVVWCAGPKGGVVPIPKSISYAKADQDAFEKYHEEVVKFLRGPHAAPFLWRHLKGRAHEMIEPILAEFGE